MNEAPGNILACYSRAESEAIATQLATLEIVTYPNAIGTGLKQAKEKLEKGVNWIWRRLSGSDLVLPAQVQTLTDQVIYRARNYAVLPKQTLVERVLAILRTRLECAGCNLERLSGILIREAATGLNIEEDLLIGQQAELVAKKYSESVLEQIGKVLGKQSPEQIRATEHTINERLSALSPIERLELQNMLNLTNLSGKAVRDAFLKTGGPLAGIAAVNMVGFGAYIALSVIVHAIFTTMLGIALPFAFYTSASSLLSLVTGPLGIVLAIAAGLMGWVLGQRRLNRSQFAMIVWTCVTHSQRDLYTPTNLLPSAQAPRLLPGSSAAGSHSSDLTRSDHELSERASQWQTAQEAHSKASSELQSNHDELRRLRQRLEKLESELSFEKKRATDGRGQLDESSSRIAILEAEVSCLSFKAAESTARVRSAESEAQSSQALLSAAREKYNAKVETRKRELEQLWGVHFPRFEFSTKALRWVAEKTFNERLEVERALIELRESEDPTSISRGKMHDSGDHHSAFKLAPKVPARIFYHPADGRVLITEILKKNEV